MSTLLGNISSQNILSDLFRRIEETGQVDFPFWLLSGPKHVGKTTSVYQHLQEVLGGYIHHDFFPLYDCSDDLGKSHPIRVDVPKQDQRIERRSGEIITHPGVRELISWMSLAPVGKLKVVFLENIERMTISAANALLKTFEEPLPHRLIIATTTSPDLLLDTIISRSFQIRFVPVSRQEMQNMIDEIASTHDAETKRFLLDFSLGQPGYVYALLEHEDLSEMVDVYQHIISILKKSGGSLNELYIFFQERNKKYSFEQLLDAILFSLADNMPLQASILETKRLLQTNVSMDTVLFDLALSSTT